MLVAQNTRMPPAALADERGGFAAAGYAGKRDPEMCQTKKGDQYYLGRKVHNDVVGRLQAVTLFTPVDPRRKSAPVKSEEKCGASGRFCPDA